MSAPRFPQVAPLPAPSARRRGVTLPEVLLVLVLLGLASTVVLPFARRSAPLTDTSDARLVADARRLAIRRAQPLRFRRSAAGEWSVAVVPAGAVLAAGTVPPGSPATDLLIDPLGGCLPVASPDRLQPMDPMTCEPPRPERRP